MIALSHVTIRRWFRRFAVLVPEVKYQLKGTVEMDEAFIGKRRYQNQQIVGFQQRTDAWYRRLRFLLSQGRVAPRAHTRHAQL